MEFVLQSVLDFILKVLGDIVPMSNVSYPSEGHTDHELVSKGR